MTPTLDDALSRLDGVRRSARGWTARCPAHDDHHPSLSVTPRTGGGVRLHCFAGCRYGDVLATLGLEDRPPARRDEREPVNVHTLALQLARRQGWVNPVMRELYRIADYIRSCSRRADALRRAATVAGPTTAAAWDALARAADCERAAWWTEAAVDEALE
jgi:hypothetical protein